MCGKGTFKPCQHHPLGSWVCKGASPSGAPTRGVDEAVALPGLAGGAAVGDVARELLHRQGLPRQRRLVDLRGAAQGRVQQANTRRVCGGRRGGGGAGFVPKSGADSVLGM
jgi:hypothetical protein